MATVSGSIVLYEQMTTPMQNIIRSMNMVISSMEEVKIAGKTAFNPASIASARQMLNQADIEIQKIVSYTNKAREAQAKYNNEVGKGKTEINGISSIMGRFAASAAAAFSVKQIISVADSYTSTAARLNLINDGLQTQKELQDMIFASADRSRTTYGAITPIISKLGVLAGDAFDSNKEMVYFAELMNKNFIIGGAGAQEQSAAMYQLTQAMAAGRLQGDEFRSILENAPLLAQAISKEMDVPMGQLRDMSREGLITADIIKAAMLNNASSIEAAYEQMPYTWAQVWSMIVNEAYQNFAPLVEWIGSGAQFVYENWNIIGPVFYGVAAAIAVYTLALGAAKVATGILHLQTLLLNKAMLSNHVGWICLLVGGAVMLFLAWAESVGGVEVAWLILKDSFLTGFESVQLSGLKAIYNIDSAGYGMINNLFGYWNSFVSYLNETIGTSFELKANIGTEVLSKQRNEIEQKEIQNAMNQSLRQASIGMTRANSSNSLDVGYIPEMKDMASYSEATANNTAEIKDSLKASVDELKLLREVASRQAIATYTTREVKLDMSGMVVNLQNETDYDGWIGKLGRDFQEVMAVSSEGLYV